MQRHFCKLYANNPSKEICSFLVFLNYTSGYLTFCKTFCLFEMAWSRAFQTCIIYHFLDNFFLQTFLLYKWILQKKFNFCKFAIFFADSKSRAQELSNDVSFVIFGHETWDLEGGGGTQHILVIKYPSRDRVKLLIGCNYVFLSCQKETYKDCRRNFK